LQADYECRPRTRRKGVSKYPRKCGGDAEREAGVTAAMTSCMKCQEAAAAAQIRGKSVGRLEANQAFGIS
jgi:hypothetical protein